MVEEQSPIIIKLGKRKSKSIKDLEKGTGKLMDEVKEVINQVKIKLDDKSDDKFLIPVVLIYSKKSKRRKKGGLLSLFG